MTASGGSCVLGVEWLRVRGILEKRVHMRNNRGWPRIERSWYPSGCLFFGHRTTDFVADFDEFRGSFDSIQHKRCCVHCLCPSHIPPPLIALHPPRLRFAKAASSRSTAGIRYMFIALVEDFVDRLVPWRSFKSSSGMACIHGWLEVIRLRGSLFLAITKMVFVKPMHLAHHLHSVPDYPTLALLSHLQRQTCFEHLLKAMSALMREGLASSTQHRP